MPEPCRASSTGLLGAKLEQRPEDRVLPDRQDPARARTGTRDLRSPLTELGVDVKEGEYIVAVNGKPTNEMANIYEAAGQHGRQAGDAEGQQRAEGEGRPRRWSSTPIGDEADAVLPRLGAGQHQEGERRDRRQGRLPARAGHAARPG